MAETEYPEQASALPVLSNVERLLADSEHLQRDLAAYETSSFAPYPSADMEEAQNRLQEIFQQLQPVESGLQAWRTARTFPQSFAENLADRARQLANADSTAQDSLVQAEKDWPDQKAALEQQYGAWQTHWQHCREVFAEFRNASTLPVSAPAPSPRSLFLADRRIRIYQTQGENGKRLLETKMKELYQGTDRILEDLNPAAIPQPLSFET